MKTLQLVLFSLLFVGLAALPCEAQTAKLVGKTLNKTMKSSSKDPGVSVPGLGDSGKKSDGGLKLGKAVGSAVGGVLKGGTKALGWATKGLNPVQITKIATSGTPFTTLLSMQGKNARKDLEDAIGGQLEKTGALDMLDSVEDLTGFDLPGGGKDKNKFVSAVTDNTIDVLDKKGAELMKGIVK